MLSGAQRGPTSPLAAPSALASGKGCLAIKGSRPPRAQHGALGRFRSLRYMRSLRNKHLSPLGHVCTRPCAGLEETEVLSSENLRSREGAVCVGAMQARSSSIHLPNLRRGLSHPEVQGAVSQVESGGRAKEAMWKGVGLSRAPECRNGCQEGWGQPTGSPRGPLGRAWLLRGGADLIP